MAAGMLCVADDGVEARRIVRNHIANHGRTTLADIATDSDLIGGDVLGDMPTGICRLLRRLT
jgi:hypothetical protein